MMCKKTQDKTSCMEVKYSQIQAVTQRESEMCEVCKTMHTLSVCLPQANHKVTGVSPKYHTGFKSGNIKTEDEPL